VADGARRVRRGLGLAALFVALPFACADRATDEATAGRNVAPIVSGTIDTKDPAVMAIVARRSRCDQPDGEPLCTGTLIAPRVVLTAAHCVERSTVAAAFEVRFGPQTNDPSNTYVVVTDVLLHPKYDVATHEYDVALLRLSDDAVPTPVPLPAKPIDASAIGSIARIVGYGVTEDPKSIPGTKREGTTKVSEVTPTSFTATASPSMTCHGDSGGPVFLKSETGVEELAGITAKGDAGCKDYAFNIRVDAVMTDFIAPYVKATETAPKGVPVGKLAPAQICMQTCSTNADCPGALPCIAYSDGKRCGLEGSPPASLGATCGSDGGPSCATGEICARYWSTGPDACRCATPCTGAPPPPIPDASTDDTSEPSAPKGDDGGGGGCAVATMHEISPWPWLGPLVAVLVRRRRRARHEPG
jgi:V8-like Glu-specific endopeptidase